MYALTVDIGGTKIAGAIVYCPDNIGVSRQVLTQKRTLLGHGSIVSSDCTTSEQSARVQHADTPLSQVDVWGHADTPAVESSAVKSYDTPFASSIPTIVEQRRVATPASEGGEAVFTAVLAVLTELQAIAQCRSLSLAGCAVSAAGVIDPTTGSVAYASNLLPGWAGVQLQQRLQQQLNLPVRVINDVHAHGLGEVFFGAGQLYSSVLVVAVGTGLGGAFVEHGKVMLGNSGVAGSIAHMLHPLAAGMVCACGSTAGHIECIASGTGKQLLYNRNLPSDCSPVTQGVEVTKRAESGELYAQAVLEASGGAFGDVLASAATLLDPAAVIITGSAAQSGMWWWNALREHFAHNALPLHNNLPLIEGTLGSQAPLFGAVTLM